MQSLRSAWTLLRVVLHIIGGILHEHYLLWRLGRGWYLQVRGQRAIQAWMQRLCRLLAVEVEYTGVIPGRPVLLAANHISWLDIIVLSSLQPYSFLAKDDVRRWPLIGHLIAMSGNLFIRRDNPKSLKRSIVNIVTMLARGRGVAIFPEGTTHATTVQPFKPGLFEAANQAGVAVQPVAIHYCAGSEPARDVAYVDEDTFIFNLLRLIRRRGLTAHLHFHPPLAPPHNRTELARHTQRAITHTLQEQAWSGMAADATAA